MTSQTVSGQEIPEDYDTIQGLAQLLDDLHRMYPTHEMGLSSQFMIAQLDLALHGFSTARPDTPRQYWLKLLSEVQRLATPDPQEQP